ncbi:MAG: PQQ-binding-like beta-propeller repeat protein [Alphaproteobacteria bacterium GM202ARS2]|nr:PQQ-binding-like beta-propeller repeat protein [Alphaproteobacteria bacterium GM202ARS2]
MRIPLLLTLVTFGFLAAACAQEQKPLEGTRLSVLTRSNNQNALNVMPRKSMDVKLPRLIKNKAWAQQGRNAAHNGGHLFWQGRNDILWQKKISSDDAAMHQLLLPPIVAEGKLFVANEDSTVIAMDAKNGTTLWQVALQQENISLSSGLAYSNGRVFVTTGFASVFALDADSGKTLWEIQLDSPIRAAPTIITDKVLVQTTDNQLIAIDPENGQRLWSHLGIVENIAILGSAHPAANKNVAVVAYSSGEIFSLKLSNGAEFWKDSLSNLNQRESALPMNDITAAPVISDNTTYIISYAGRMTALDLRSGSRLWERQLQGQQTPWLSGQYLFLVTEDNKLLCIDREDGKAVWIKQLPVWKDPSEKDERILWRGPIVSNGRVLVMSSYGAIRRHNITNGALYDERQVIYNPVLLPPIIADGILYILSGDGKITALR